jgi:hypothetical protein
MREVTVWLTDDNANGSYPFIHQLGKRLRSRTTGLEGIVKNAKFVGAEQPTGGSYTVTYQIETDDGVTVLIPDFDLEPTVVNAS